MIVDNVELAIPNFLQMSVYEECPTSTALSNSILTLSEIALCLRPDCSAIALLREINLRIFH